MFRPPRFFPMLLLPDLVVMAAGFSTVCAQSTAKLQGVVTGAHGALVTGARITDADRETGMQPSAVTNQTGNYQITALAVARYRVDTQAPGFAPRWSKP